MSNRIIYSLLLLTLISVWVKAEIIVELTLLRNDAQIFTIGDLDFTQVGGGGDYFSATILNTGGDTPDPALVKLCMQITYNGVVIATGESDPFNLPANQLISFTSSQLNQGTIMINGQLVGIASYDVDFNVVENLRDEILRTGTAPAGEYAFDLGYKIDLGSGFGVDCIIVDPQPEDNRLVITNPTTLELLFPGRSISENDIEEISTIFPYFQWISDANPVNDRYNIYVYEKRPEDQTPQDVLSHPPILHIEDYEDNFFQYPTETNPVLPSGTLVGPMRLLEFGKTYYWFVESVVATGTGEEILESDLFRFKIADLSRAATNSQQILAFLQQLLGPDYENVLAQLREQGYEPTGNLSFEGSQSDVSVLIDLLNKLVQGQITIKKVEVY